MFGPAKAERSAETQIQTAGVLQRVDQPFGVELRSGALDALDQHIRRHIALERNVIGRLAGEEFGQRGLVFEHDRRIARHGRHHLGHDDAVGVARAQQLQFFGKRGAADERDVRVDHLREDILGLLDEARRRPVGRNHHHRLDRLQRLQLLDRLVDVHGVARVVEPDNGGVVDTHCAKRLGDALEAGISVGVLLREHGDLLRLQPADFHQIAHRRIGLFRIAGAVVEHITVGRVAAEDAGAGEGPEEQHPPFQRERDGNHRGRRSDISDDAEHLFLFVKLLHRLGGPGRLIAVIGRNQTQHPAIDAAGLVDAVEGAVDPELHLPPELLGGARERGSDAEADFAVGDPALRRLGADRRRRGGSDRRGRSDDAGKTRRGRRDRAFEVRQLPVGGLAIGPSRRDGGTAFRDAAVEHQREVGTYGLVGGGLADHGHEFVHHRLDARPRDILAGQCRADDRPDAAGKVAYDVCVGGRRRGGAGDQGAYESDHAAMSVLAAQELAPQDRDFKDLDLTGFVVGHRRFSAG